MTERQVLEGLQHRLRQSRLLLENLDRGDLENLDRAHLFEIQDRLLELREEVERVRNLPLKTGV